MARSAPVSTATATATATVDTTTASACVACVACSDPTPAPALLCTAGHGLCADCAGNYTTSVTQRAFDATGSLACALRPGCESSLGDFETVYPHVPREHAAAFRATRDAALCHGRTDEGAEVTVGWAVGAIEDCLVAKCPQCHTAVHDFDACFSVSCRCGWWFCAYCMLHYGTSASVHMHVSECPSNIAQSVHAPFETFTLLRRLDARSAVLRILEKVYATRRQEGVLDVLARTQPLIAEL